MPETVIIASKLAVPLRITEADPSPEKPGLSPELRSVVLNGARHPAAVGEEGITTDVPSDLWEAWKKANPTHPAITGEMLREISEDDLKSGKVRAIEFGFQPALDRAQADAEKASAGSLTAEPGPVSSEDMTPTSDAPADDSPRSVPGKNVGRPRA